MHLIYVSWASTRAAMREVWPFFQQATHYEVIVIRRPYVWAAFSIGGTKKKRKKENQHVIQHHAATPSYPPKAWFAPSLRPMHDAVSVEAEGAAAVHPSWHLLHEAKKWAGISVNGKYLRRRDDIWQLRTLSQSSQTGGPCSCTEGRRGGGMRGGMLHQWRHTRSRGGGGGHRAI